MGVSNLQVINLDQLVNRTKVEIIGFTSISFLDIYRIFNTKTYTLSKLVVGDMDGLINFEEFLDDTLIDSESISVFYGYHFNFG